MALTPAEWDAADATALAALVRRGEVAPGELLDVALDRVAALNPRLNAVAHLAEDAARAAIARGLPDGPLRGVPLLLKDLGGEAADIPSSGGSRLLAGKTWPRDCAVVERLRAVGVVLFGRTTSPEGGVGPVTEAAVYGGPTRNPWDLSRTPGGSSGGAGAAVAAGMIPAAHGSDGGGSIRIPASNCGLFGFKGTRARLPDGPFAGEGWAGMAIEGFLTRSVRDMAALMEATHGPDLGAPYPPPPLSCGFLAALDRPPGRLRIALSDRAPGGAAIHPDCARAVREAGRLLEDLGHAVEEAAPEADHAAMTAAWTDIVACGAALWVRAAVARRGRALEPGEIEPVTQGACAHAASLSGADYLAAVEAIHAFGRGLAAAFDRFDVLLCPTMAEPPAEIGRFSHQRPEFRDFRAYRLGPGGVFPYSPFCAAFNAGGQPAASLPLGASAEGLPVGVHLAMRVGADAELMALCAQIERAAPWAGRRPPA